MAEAVGILGCTKVIIIKPAFAKPGDLHLRGPWACRHCSEPEGSHRVQGRGAAAYRVLRKT